jgi:hypothetical protein
MEAAPPSIDTSNWLKSSGASWSLMPVPWKDALSSLACRAARQACKTYMSVLFSPCKRGKVISIKPPSKTCLSVCFGIAMQACKSRFNQTSVQDLSICLFWYRHASVQKSFQSNLRPKPVHLSVLVSPCKRAKVDSIKPPSKTCLSVCFGVALHGECAGQARWVQATGR